MSEKDWRRVEQWTALELPSRRKGDNLFACQLANGMAWRWQPPMEADFVKKSDYFSLVNAYDKAMKDRDAMSLASRELIAAHNAERSALKSIAANTCCGSCQEAALVASAALAKATP